MRRRSNIRRFAAKLLAISMSDGLLDEKKISAILKILAKDTGILPILREYYRLIKHTLIKEKLLIYSDEEISDPQKNAIVSCFEKKLGRKLRVQLEKDRTLIAGIRIQLNDRIYEHSIRSTLESLTRSSQSAQRV